MARHAAIALSNTCDYISEPPQSALLGPYYRPLLESLLECAEKQDPESSQLRENATFALTSLIHCNVPDTENVLIEFYKYILMKCMNIIEGVGGALAWRRLLCMMGAEWDW